MAKLWNITKEQARADYEKVRECFERANREDFAFFVAQFAELHNSADTDAEDGDESDDN